MLTALLMLLGVLATPLPPKPFPPAISYSARNAVQCVINRQGQGDCTVVVFGPGDSGDLIVVWFDNR